jgi:ATP-dependent Clp protease ATP-binding subunit ClpC
MFERYTEAARHSIFYARYEAGQTGSRAIGTEHLLLGIARADSERPQALLPIATETLRVRIPGEKPVFGKPLVSGDLPLDHAVKRTLAYAAEEAEMRRQGHIGIEHLLVGIAREKSCPAAKILSEYGLTLAELRRRVEGVE